MSHIPNSAMPHAAPNAASESDQGNDDSSSAFSFSERAGSIADKARAHPTAAVAAGAAIVAGALAAAAIPLVRARKKTGSSGGSKKKKAS